MVAKFTTQTLKLDREQAFRQLELLGDKPDKVYLTAFFPKGDPRTKGENRDKGRKASRLNYSEVEAWQAEGRGVYLVANGYGHGKEDVKSCRTIFYEHDNLEKDTQLTLWQTLGMPEPTFQVDSGGISIHNYWVLEEPLHPELWAFQQPNGQWRGLQADLLELAKADRSLINPNRVMRLAGAWYFTHDENGTHPVAQSRIIGGCSKRYSYAELREIIPRAQPPLTKPLPHNKEASAEELLDFRKVGHLLPHWNERGRKGWATFQCPVHTSDGKKHSLDHIHVNLSNGAWEAHCGCDRKVIYQTVCDTVGHKPSGRSFGGGIGSSGGNRQGNSGAGGSSGDGGDGNDRGKVVKLPGFEPLSVEQVTQKIDELVATGATGSYLTGQLNRLAAASQYYIGELRKLFYERLGEADLEVDRDGNRGEIENLLQLSTQSPNLHDYIPEELATPLTAWCEWLSIRPAVALTALLAGVSSLHKVGTELVLHRNQNFRVPPTLYGALVSPSGQRKSPVFTNIIRQPLSQLRQEKIDAYNAAMADYQAAMEAWEQSEHKGEKPSKPKDPTLYYFTNATGEAIPVQASKAPDKALLALIDELSGLLKSENSYRNGRGSDKQDLLSYFDGTGQTVLRAGGVRVDLDKIYLSMYGTIQPDVLKGHMADCTDPDGQWARFLFVNQPLEAATLSDDDGQAVQIRDRIAECYRRIEKIPEMEYFLSREAFKRYQPIYNQLERLRVTQAKSGMAAVYSKAQGYIGRLALNLHVLWELASGKTCPDEEIQLFIMEMAIALIKFYIGQVKVIHADADEENLPRHITRMMELSKRLEANGLDGWVKAKQVQDLFAKKKRPSAQQIRDWMNEAVVMGFGRTRGQGNRLEYHWLCDNNNSPDDSPSPKNLGNTWGTLGEDVPQVKTTIYQGVQENLGNLGKGIPKFEEENPPVDNDQKLRRNDPPPLEPPPPELDLEGGSVPQPSPTLPQETQTLEELSDSDFEKNLGNPSPSVPQVPQVCDSSAVACVTVQDNQPSDTALPQVETPGHKTRGQQSQAIEAALEKTSEAHKARSPKVGQKVRVHCPGSKRDRLIGTVRQVSGVEAVVWFDDSSLSSDLRRLECPVSWLEVLPTTRK